MKAEVRYGLLRASENEEIRSAAMNAAGRYREEPHDNYLVEIQTDRLSAEAVELLIPMLEESERKRAARALKAAQGYIAGDFEKRVPSFPAFPEIAPRDIKMLLRLVLRVSTTQNVELNPDLFRRIAMFRAVEISDKPVELGPSESLI